MSVQKRNIFGPSLAGENLDYAGQNIPGGEIAGDPLEVSNGPLGETGVADNNADRHAGIVSSHQAAATAYAAAPDNHSGAGMVLGSSTPLVTEGGDGSHGDTDADSPNQGTPMKGLAGTDGFRSSAGEGDSGGDQSGAGKEL